MLKFLQNTSEKLQKHQEKKAQEFQRLEMMLYGMNESEYAQYLKDKATADQLKAEEQEALQKERTIARNAKLALQEQLKESFAKLLGFENESFHLATLVSIRNVNALDGGTRKNNVVHIITKNRSLLCKQKIAGSTALSSDWIDDIQLEKSNVTCPKCLKKCLKP